MDRYKLGILFLIFSITISFGQAENREKVRSMFENLEEGLWIYNYEGVFDDSYPIKMILGINGDQVRAIITYDEKKTNFTLEGSLKDDVYILEEYSADNQHTASVKLVKHDNQLNGEWTSISERKKFNIKFKRIDESKDIDFISPFYYKRYANIDNTISLTMQKSIYNLDIRLLLNSNFYEWKIYNKNNDKELNLESGDKTFSFIPLTDGKLLIRIVGTDRKNYNVELSQNLKFNCNTKVNYSSKSEAHFPILNDKEFDDWMQKTISNIWNNNKKILDDNSTSPYSRYDKELFVRTMVVAYTEHILSGLIIIENKSDKVETIPFSYNLDKKRFFDIDKLFRKNKKNAILKEYINIEYENIKKEKEGLKKQWLLDCKYDYILVGENGLELYSDYNTVFGYNSIHIPYIEISDRLKYKPKK